MHGIKVLRGLYAHNRKALLQQNRWMNRYLFEYDESAFNIAVHVRAGDQDQDQWFRWQRTFLGRIHGPQIACGLRMPTPKLVTLEGRRTTH